MLKRIISVIIMLLLAGSLLSCANNTEEINLSEANDAAELPEEAHLVPGEGGILRLCMYNADTLNPLITQSEANSHILALAYDGLFKFGKDLYPEYNLCEQVSVSTDGLNISLKIRDNVYFHDGTALTATDVQFSVLLAKQSGGIYSESLANISDVSVSGREVNITLAAPVFNFISNLTFPVLKAEASVDAALKAKESYRPNGTGLYKLSEYKLSKSLVMSATNAHFDGKKPYINEISVEIVKDRHTAINMLENSLCDVLLPSVAKKGDYSENSGVKEVPAAGGSFVFLGINNQHTVLLDSQIRKAMSYATDRDALASFVGENIKKSVIPVYPDSWLFYEAAQGSDYDPVKAVEIINELGWSDTDNDHLLDKIVIGEKTNLYLDILVNSENTERARLAEYIKKSFGECGIATTITSVPFAEYQSRIADGNYDLFIGEVQFGNNQDISGFISDAGNVFGAYKEELARAFYEAKLVGEPDGIKAKYQVICNELFDSMPLVGLYFKKDAVLVNSRIKGEISVNRSNFFANICDWFIY